MGELFLGVAADDFTGASDAASFLVEAGIPTVLFNGVPDHKPELKDDTRAIVVAMKTRTVPAQQAVEETMAAFSWMKEMGVKQLYLKYCSTFDSTKDGNIGPVTDAVLEAYGLPYTVLCPSLPVNGRTVKDGKLYVNGVLLEESHMKDHPLTPMRDSDVVRLMEAQGKYKGVVLPLEQIGVQSEEDWKKKAQENGPFYIVPDYYEDAHGDKIAEAFGNLPFLTGGSGLAGALGRWYVKQLAAKEGSAEQGTGQESGAAAAQADGKDREAVEAQAAGQASGAAAAQAGAEALAAGQKEAAGGKAVVLAGSCSAITLKQIADYQEKGHVSFRIQPHKLLDGTLTKEMIWSWIEAQEDAALIYSSASPEDLQKSQALGKERVAAKIEETLSDLAEYASRHGYHRLIIAGGETSGAVTKKLGYEAFYIGESVAPGVPVMTPLENQKLRLVLKSGNFGQTDFFQRACDMTK